MNNVYEFYRDLLDPQKGDKNTQIYEKAISKRPAECEPPICVVDGYEYRDMSKTQLYRVGKWFYKKQNDEIYFLSTYDVMLSYVRKNYGGPLVFSVKERAFVMNRRNFAKIKIDYPELYRLINNFFNLEATASDPRNSDQFLVSDIKKVSTTVYMERQKEIFVEICRIFGVKGTYLSRMRAIEYPYDQLEEYMFYTKYLKVKRDAALNWFNYGLKIPARILKNFDIKQPFSNFKFKAVRFAERPATIGRADLICYNVHQFEPLNYLLTDVPARVLDVVRGAQIVVMPEFEPKYLDLFRRVFKYNMVVPNGGTFLFAGTRAPSKMQHIRWANRDAILIEAGGQRIMGVHLEIGGRFIFNGNKLVPRDEFIKIYGQNVKIRTAALKHLLTFEPDIICGDFNFIPESPEMEILNEYYYTALGDTSYNGMQVDYIFTKKKGLKSERIVPPDALSDHYAVGLQMPIRGGGNKKNSLLIILCLIFCFILIFHELFREGLAEEKVEILKNQN